jgi:hypothetical protein
MRAALQGVAAFIAMSWRPSLAMHWCTTTATVGCRVILVSKCHASDSQIGVRSFPGYDNAAVSQSV